MLHGPPCSPRRARASLVALLMTITPSFPLSPLSPYHPLCSLLSSQRRCPSPYRPPAILLPIGRTLGGLDRDREESGGGGEDWATNILGLASASTRIAAPYYCLNPYGCSLIFMRALTLRAVHVTGAHPRSMASFGQGRHRPSVCVVVRDKGVGGGAAMMGRVRQDMSRGSLLCPASRYCSILHDQAGLTTSVGGYDDGCHVG